MSTNQLFFAMAGLILTVVGMGIGFLKYYIDVRFDSVNQRFDAVLDSVYQRFTAVNQRFDAVLDSVDQRFTALNQRLDSIDRQLKTLIDFMMQHEGRIAVLEERTRNL